MGDLVERRLKGYLTPTDCGSAGTVSRSWYQLFWQSGEIGDQAGPATDITSKCLPQRYHPLSPRRQVFSCRKPSVVFAKQDLVVQTLQGEYTADSFWRSSADTMSAETAPKATPARQPSFSAAKVRPAVGTSAHMSNPAKSASHPPVSSRKKKPGMVGQLVDRIMHLTAGEVWGLLREAATPKNILLILLLLTIIISGAILFMVMVGMVQKSTAQKTHWIEVSSQVLNACFTFQAVVSQPARARYARWALRIWRNRKARTSEERTRFEAGASLAHAAWPWLVIAPEDPPHSGGGERDAGGAPTPASMSPDARNVNAIAPFEGGASPASGHPPPAGVRADPVALAADPAGDAEDTPAPPLQMPARKFCLMVLLLNLNCIFQYPITTVMWAWARHYWRRPGWVVMTFLPLSFGCGLSGGLMLKVHELRVKSAMKEQQEAREEAAAEDPAGDERC